MFKYSSCRNFYCCYEIPVFLYLTTSTDQNPSNNTIEVCSNTIIIMKLL